jgi:hypothetical protein
MHNGPTAREQQASPLWAARHQRFLAVVQNKDCQLYTPIQKDLLMPTLPCGMPQAFEHDPFCARALPELKELREPVCNGGPG